MYPAKSHCEIFYYTILKLTIEFFGKFLWAFLNLLNAELKFLNTKFCPAS